MLDPTTTFEHAGTTVSLSFEGMEAQASEDLPEPERAFRFVNRAAFELERPDDLLDGLVAADRRIELVAFLVPIINRAFRAARNFGTAAHIKELRAPNTEEDSVSLLRGWNLESTNAQDEWVRLLEPVNAFFGALAATGSPPLYPFRIAFWPDVNEAIQDNLIPGPEQEFLANSIEYLRSKNYRSALLEAVVCLEIVTSQFLTAYLREKGLSENRIERVFTKDIGLTSRIGLLLELILTPNEKRGVLDNVLVAVNWRNTIVHRTGNLPQGVPEVDVGDKTRSVLGLAILLAQKRDQILNTPEAKAKAAELGQRWNGLSPHLTRTERHHWLVEVQFRLLEEFPNEATLAAMMDDVIGTLRTGDVRFDPAHHLFVRFSQLSTTIYVWSEGQLRKLADPIAPLRPPVPPQPVQ